MYSSLPGYALPPSGCLKLYFRLHMCLLQCIVVCCNVLQCAALCQKALEPLIARLHSREPCVRCVAVCCVVLLCAAQLLFITMCCSVLQCVAICYSFFAQNMYRISVINYQLPSLPLPLPLPRLFLSLHPLHDQATGDHLQFHAQHFVNGEEDCCVAIKTLVIGVWFAEAIYNITKNNSAKLVVVKYHEFERFIQLHCKYFVTYYCVCM